MLVIRMQRTGRKGHAMFRMVVQDSRRTPTSGVIVEQLGSYDPHRKALTINQEKAVFYLAHGAQPSNRVIGLFEKEKITLPKWVKPSKDKKKNVRNADKRRSTAVKIVETGSEDNQQIEPAESSETIELVSKTKES